MIDAGIYNALGRGVKSVRDWQVEDEQRAQAAQAQELNALNLSNARATAGDNALVRQDQATIRNALAGMKPGATQEELAGAYEGTRTPTGLTQAQAIHKALAEAAKLKAQTAQAEAAAGASGASRATSEYKLKIDQHTQALKDISTFQTPADAMADVQRKVQSGELPMDRAQAVAQQIQSMQTPDQWKQWQQQTRYRLLDVKDQLEQEWKAAEAKRAEGKDALAAVNQDIMIVNGKPVINQPKQRAFVERAKASVAPGGAQPITLQVDPVSGQTVGVPTKAIPGQPLQTIPVMAPGGKPLGGKAGEVTEGERNAGGYHARMVEATKLLDKYEESGRQTYGTRALEAIPGVGRAVAGEAMTATQQQYKQAQADWVRAKLRKESGAAIGVDEMAQEIATYFPSPWDGPDVVKQKQQAREVANKAMQGAAGRGAQTPSNPANPLIPDASAIDAELARRAKGK